MGTPCGRVETLDRRLGGLQAWGRRSNTHSTPPEPMTEPDSQQTRLKDHQWTRVRARARPNNHLLHLDFPVRTIPLLWGALWPPHRCPHCEVFPNVIFPLPPYSVNDPDPHPIMKTCFPNYSPFPDPDMTPQQVTHNRPPIQFFVRLVVVGVSVSCIQN